MPSFSFVHAADLHLDSPFIGIGRLTDGHSHVARALCEATFEAFEAVIDLCIERSADLLLVAGDIYDGADRSLRAQLCFRDGLKRLSEHGIRAYVVHGNHDPLDGWSCDLQMPETVHIFRDRLESVVFEKDGFPVARIHGISYPSRRLDTEFGKGMQREGDEPFQIGLLHCNAEGHPLHDPYAPRSIADLTAARLDYWALGHVHECSTLNAGDPFIGYPGNTQGRHIKEQGPRGCYFVQVTTEGKLARAPEFVCVDRVRWIACDIDISSIGTIDELIGAIGDRMDAFADAAEGRAVVARIAIVGRGPLHGLLLKPDTLNTLLEQSREHGVQRSPFIWIERLIGKTQPAIDLERRRDGQDFLGDLLRLIDDIRHTPDRLNGLSDVVKELFQHNRAQRLLEDLDEASLGAILNEAEIRCAELIMDEID